MFRFNQRITVLLKIISALLLLAAATSASAANTADVITTAVDAEIPTSERCSEAGASIKRIADYRDGGVMMSTLMMRLAGQFPTKKAEDMYFRIIAIVYFNGTASAEALEKADFDACVRRSKT